MFLQGTLRDTIRFYKLVNFNTFKRRYYESLLAQFIYKSCKSGKFKQILNMPADIVRKAPCQDEVVSGSNVDLGMLPIQTCWPGDAGPLITWPLVVTRGPEKNRQNLGIYRQQGISKNKLIMRWLSHRGGALDYQDWSAANPGKPVPVAVPLGADPATILGAVTPVPETLPEYAFAGT